MIDVGLARVQEVYAKWEANADIPRGVIDSNPSQVLTSATELRRAGLQAQKQGVRKREQIREMRYKSLYRIKETEISVPESKSASSNFLHYCCNSCTPLSREKDSPVGLALKQHKFNYSNLLFIPPTTNLVSKIFSHISYVSTFKKYKYPKVTHTVLNDERLKEAIKQVALETCTDEGCSEQEAFRRTEGKAKSILLKMQSSISDFLLRFTAWALYKVLPCFIQSAAIQSQQIEMLKKANDTGLPLIFLPLHRSHLDYIMISFLLLSNDIRSPLVAAGNNLKIPFFGWLASGLGAFFIKRRIDPISGRKDILYRATLHTYIMESLRAGHNIEFFVEGGRTRTGKPCMPKGGILSVIIDAYMDGTIEDALLVPMSINYERLVDGNFVREQLGQPKKMETFTSTIKAFWNTLMGNYGIVKIDICQPFSLREMLKSQQNKIMAAAPSEKTLKVTASFSSLYGTDIVIEEHRQLVDDIARHVVYDCSKTTPIMSTNVVAFLLLNRFRDGCKLHHLVEAFDKTWKELERQNRDVAFCGETIDIVDHALDILGPGLIKQQRQEITDTIDGETVKSEAVVVIHPVAILPNVIELSYYSNTVLLNYVMDSVVATALYALVKNQINDPQAIANNNITVKRADLISESSSVCDILKYEFIFCKPCQELESVISSSIENLIQHGIIYSDEECLLEEEMWSKRYAKTLDDSSDEEFAQEQKRNNEEYKLSLELEPSKTMEFLHTLLRPLIDTYTFSAFSLKHLVGRTLSERDLIHEIFTEIKKNFDQGIVNYGESLCIDPIKNSLKVFLKWDVLECHAQENIKIYYLKGECDDELVVTEVYNEVAKFKWSRYNSN